MKNTYKYILGIALMVSAASCSMDTDLNQYKDAESAFSTLNDLSNAVNGTYYNLGRSGFLGRNAIALGDISGGVCKGSEAKGWFASIGAYSISTSDDEFEACWHYGYSVIDQATRTINGGLALTDLSDDDQATLNLYLGESYGLRALANWYLVNLFALPYQKGTDNLGLVIVEDEPVEAFQQVTRSTVGQTYDFILRDIVKAENLLQGSDRGSFYINYGAMKALEARVDMDQAKYSDAITAAKAALDWLDAGDGTASDGNPSNSKYLSMWTESAGSSVAQGPEDIFYIKKSTDDNLGSTSLNTLYGSYENVLSNWVPGIFDDTDIRTGLIDDESYGHQPAKYNGISGSAATANIPIFRKSEMSLIIAEANAHLGNISEAQNYLMFTAKRNTAYADGTKTLPSTQDGLLSFISMERVRELFAEGHRFYDARRLGEKVQSNYYTDFDIQNFCFPIPEAEINAKSGVEQNPNWSAALP